MTDEMREPPPGGADSARPRLPAALRWLLGGVVAALLGGLTWLLLAAKSEPPAPALAPAAPAASAAPGPAARDEPPVRAAPPAPAADRRPAAPKPAAVIDTPFAPARRGGDFLPPRHATPFDDAGGNARPAGSGEETDAASRP